MEPRKRERYIRWQNHRISQFSFSINLFLSFGVASLAFAITQKLADDSKISESIDTVILWWACSCAFGCLATLSRLLDFRYTARKILAPSFANKFVAKYSGAVSWSSFWLQVGSYVVGAVILLRAVLNA